MNSLTNEQKARIFALYLGCEVLINDVVDDEPVTKGYLTGLTAVDEYSAEVQRHNDVWAEEEPEYIDINEVKLLLTQLSKITENDALIVWGMIPTHQIMEYPGKTFVEFYERNNYLSWAQKQFLVQYGYAVSLFVAPNHPDNGKDAITLGLAVDRTTLK